MRRARSGNPKVAVCYLRASTDDQRISPDVQRNEMARWAAREGVQIVAWHVDQGVSGATPIDERPALCAALAAVVEHGAGVLLVSKRDRIARDVVIAAMTERAAAQAGARLTTADGAGNGDTPADALMRTMLDGFSAYERALIRGRTKAALAAKKARGERIGEVHFGFRLGPDGVHVEPDPTEQATLGAIHALRADGLTIRGIAAELAVRGVVGRTGRPLSHTQVHRMLRAA